MANTVRGNCVEVNSANQYIMAKETSGIGGGGASMFLKGVALAMTTTDAQLQLGIGLGTSTGAFVQLDKWMPSISWDGLWVQNVIVNTISNGTGFIYFA